ncbi:hypothetical protein OG562_29705 [Streptomyces sp. NBC_01275]|uniref:hypothetical protein n=1 Tax=Streptomyces sp. NBC_01275 TaxID=2903807 RepID=UPI00225BCD5D|nr:hypothetical protein [Streptomyces sp. NBC_01275]MCX4765076.1 hypothetical protein [Streptomyces sp. NBC_01275]
MKYLGPLELIENRWVIGDPTRKDGLCLVLAADGMEHHRRGVPEPQAVVPWTRFVGVGVSATHYAWESTRTAGVLDVLGNSSIGAGRSGCSVGGLLRHPYEDWSVNYTHHRRRYTAAHVTMVEALFRKVSAAKAPHLLGDPVWLGTAVARLAPLPARWGPPVTRQMRETIEDLGI